MIPTNDWAAYLQGIDVNANFTDQTQVVNAEVANGYWNHVKGDVTTFGYQSNETHSGDLGLKGYSEGIDIDVNATSQVQVVNAIVGNGFANYIGGDVTTVGYQTNETHSGDFDLPFHVM